MDKLSELIRELRAGVQYERHGNMEVDTFSANQLMREAAKEISRLRKLVKDVPNANV